MKREKLQKIEKVESQFYVKILKLLFIDILSLDKFRLVPDEGISQKKIILSLEVVR